VQAPIFVFSGTGFKPQFTSRGRSFSMIPGFRPYPFQEFGNWPRLRVVGSCIRSVLAIWPVGSITFVGLRNFDIPQHPGSHSWPSALRFIASPCFGLSNSSVSRFVIHAVRRASAIVGIWHSNALRLLYVAFLHYEYRRELIETKVTFYLPDSAA
jgi:hypothetical protein